MKVKKGKYDTNPLDPEVARHTEEVWGKDDSNPATQDVKGATREVGASGNDSARGNIYSEAPTRRYDNKSPLDTGYPSVFVPPTYAPPAPYQRPDASYQSPGSQKPTSRPVAGIGLPEKWALVLPYAPFYIGVVAALIELFLVPRKEVKVRFHAAQGLTLHIAILIAETIFGVVGAITNSSVGGILFRLAAFIFLFISMIRVWRGETHRIAPLAEPSHWFNEKIEPRKQKA